MLLSVNNNLFLKSLPLLKRMEKNDQTAVQTLLGILIQYREYTQVDKSIFAKGCALVDMKLNILAWAKDYQT